MQTVVATNKQGAEARGLGGNLVKCQHPIPGGKEYVPSRFILHKLELRACAYEPSGLFNASE